VASYNKSDFSFGEALVPWKHGYSQAPAAELNCLCRVQQQAISAPWQWSLHKYHAGKNSSFHKNETHYWEKN